MAAVIAVGVWVSTGGLINVTRRVGQGGRGFAHYRFKTRVGVPPLPTRFGRLIGNLSLDDIPGFWNVICGDLSLVGPRPARVEEVQFEDPRWQKVLTVRPGLCSPSILTLLDRFNLTDVQQRIEPDVAYVDRRSWVMDVRLMLTALWRWLRMGHLKGQF